MRPADPAPLPFSIRTRGLVIAAALAMAVSAAAQDPDEPTSHAFPSRDATLYRDGWIDLNKNGEKDPYEDPARDVDARLDDLLQRMSIEEKTCQLATLYGFRRVLEDALPTDRWHEEIWKDGIANIDEQLNGLPGSRKPPVHDLVWPPSDHARAMNEIQRWFIEETRLGVPVDFTNEGIRGICHRKATNFPAQIGVGATWDQDLVERIGRITGREAKALGYTNIYSPILDLARDPRWGRVVECYGEDPYHVARLGVRQALGLRAEGVAATAKHFAVYSIPKGGRDGDARTDPHVARREMETIYLHPFESAIREAHLLGVMSSYNDYDAIPVSGSATLLIDALRGRMGFTGYVVSDSNAVRYLWSKHRVAPTYKDAVGLYVQAGGNVRTAFRPPSTFLEPLRELIRDGELPVTTIDARVRDVLRVKFELGLFDRPYVDDPDRADRTVHCEDHAAVALEAARKSIVLLKNEGGLLPLRKDLAHILVCGPNADTIEHSISRYGPTGGSVISVLDGIRAAVAPSTTVEFVKGCEIADSRWPQSEILPEPPSGKDAERIREAVAAAERADAIVAVLGESERTIGESKSRTDLGLTGFQLDLVQALHRTGKPIVAVLINGRALTVNWLDAHVPAVVEAWFPGEWCGRAVADVLFGDYNPGGKLPVTFPRTVGQLPFNFPARPGSQAGQGKGDDPNGVGNTRIYGALYPFGHGLSYTTFDYANLEITPDRIPADGTVQVSVDVTNTGDRAGDEVVQLYLRDDYSSVITYEMVLRGFERVALAAGETRRVVFQLGPRDLELLDADYRRVVEPGTFHVWAGSSSADLRLDGTFEVVASAGRDR